MRKVSGVMGEQLVEETTDRRAVAPASAAAGHGNGRVSPGLPGVAFVLLWSSGYPAARIALDHGGPFTLLMLRFGVAGLVFAALAGLGGVAWPRGRAALHSALVGVLQLGLQFGALYWAAAQGVNVGLIALVIGTMPIVTALLGRALFREAVRPLQWFGFAVGFAGVALAVGESVAPGRGAGPAAYLAVLAGLLALSVGTLYQKRHASNVDPRTGLAVQHLAAALLVLPFAVHAGLRADASVALFASLGWMICVNSLTAFGLFFMLLRRGVVSQVATLFFLMPPVTAVIDYLLLGDALTAYKLGGLALAALGVFMATRPHPESATARPQAALRPAPVLPEPRAAATRTRLRDGRRVLIRPVVPEDLNALRRFFAALSPATRRLRFHGQMNVVPDRLLQALTTLDGREHVGFIAEADERAAEGGPLVVAEARYARCRGSDAAELALVVADGWRRVGLGASLTQTLLHQARAAGVRRLCGDALRDNEAIRRFMVSLGARASETIDRGAAVRLCLGTRPDPSVIGCRG